MDIAKTISTNLTAWMDSSKDLDTIKKVEEKSGVGFGTVRRTKKGDANITVEKLTLIAWAFKRHPAELLIDKELSGVYALPNPPPAPQANEPEAPNIVTFPDPLLVELQTIAAKISPAGLNRLIERAAQLAEDYPAESLGKVASSQ